MFFLTKMYEEMLVGRQTVTIEIRQTGLNMFKCCQNIVTRKIGKIVFFSPCPLKMKTHRLFKRHFGLLIA